MCTFLHVITDNGEKMENVINERINDVLKLSCIHKTVYTDAKAKEYLQKIQGKDSRLYLT